MSDDHSKETPQEKITRLSNALGLDKIIQRQEEQAKMLDGVIHELGNTNQNISNLKTWLESLINPSAGTTATATATATPGSQQIGVAAMMDPSSKIEMIKSVAEIVQMLRGGSPAQAASSSINMQEMLMNWFARVMQASLDGMASQVYGIQMNPPKGILNSAPRVRMGNIPEHGVE